MRTLLLDENLTETETVQGFEEVEREPIPLDELLIRADDVGYELIDGQLVERHMGANSSGVGTKVSYRLLTFFENTPLGHVFGSDCGFQCFAGEPKQMRKADVSFVAAGRFPGEVVPGGFVKLAPDLVVEVVSPNDEAEEVEAKRIEWLASGVRLVWVVFPRSRTIHASRPDGRYAVYSAAEVLPGEDVLPGFSCGVGELFA